MLRGKSLIICGMIATAALLYTVIPFALAQPASPDQDSSSPRPGRDRSPTSTADIWDANRDGVYTCDEWKGYLGRMFDRADRNHDGILTPAEFEGVRRPGSALADADFGYFDENQDGKITRSEFVGKPNEFILQHDKNGDCRVTPEELKDHRNRAEAAKRQGQEILTVTRLSYADFARDHKPERLAAASEQRQAAPVQFRSGVK